MNKLVECIEIKEGVTAFVGGGGKTSTIYTLAKELRRLGKKVIVTTTTKMYFPESNQVRQTLVAPTLFEVEEALSSEGVIAVARECLEGKILGVSDEDIQHMKKLADYVLVEADGSKHLPIKVPAYHEPVIPKASEHVVIVAGMRALGRPLKEVCFRREEAIAFLGVDVNHRFRKEDIVRIITDPLGLRKGVEARKVTVILNQVDELGDLQEAYLIGEGVKQLGIGTVILASVKQQKWQKV